MKNLYAVKTVDCRCSYYSWPYVDYTAAKKYAVEARELNRICGLDTEVTVENISLPFIPRRVCQIYLGLGENFYNDEFYSAGMFSCISHAEDSDIWKQVTEIVNNNADLYERIDLNALPGYNRGYEFWFNADSGKLPPTINFNGKEIGLLVAKLNRGSINK